MNSNSMAKSVTITRGLGSPAPKTLVFTTDVSPNMYGESRYPHLSTDRTLPWWRESMKCLQSPTSGARLKASELTLRILVSCMLPTTGGLKSGKTAIYAVLGQIWDYRPNSNILFTSQSERTRITWANYAAIMFPVKQKFEKGLDFLGRCVILHP